MLQQMLKVMGARLFCASLIWVLSDPTRTHSKAIKESGRRLVPFLFNMIQDHMYQRLGRNNRVLKPRQSGFTTFFLLCRLFLPIITAEGKNGLLISQNSKYAAKHFQMVRRAYKYVGAVDPYDDSKNELCISLKRNLLHTEYSNRHELVFDVLDSRLMVESAEVEEAAQGVTLHHVVSSETARWPGDPEATTSNVKGALIPGGTYDEESTANGMGGYFCEQYMASVNEESPDAVPHYYSWWWDPAYKGVVDKTGDTRLLTEVERDELEQDLTEEEYAIIRKMHLELEQVAYVG
jgi:hypothetical protein